MNDEATIPHGQQQFYDIMGQEPPPSVPFPHDEIPRRSAPSPTSPPARPMEPEQEPRTPRTELREQMQEARDVPVPDSPVHDAMPNFNVLQPKNMQAGRGTRELNPKRFDASEKAEFDKADAKQLQTWIDKGAIRILSAPEALHVPRDRILPGRSRMVRTNKADPGSPLQARSRIVVPGHLDQDLGSFRSDAPTSPQTCLHMLLQLAAVVVV